MRFSDVIGHGEIKELLRRSVDEGRVSHGQLFSGRSGYGAMPLAMAYAQYLNCTARRDGDSCGECPSCVKTAALVHPDVHFVFPVNAPSKGGATKPTSDRFLTQWREKMLSTGGYFDREGWYDAIELGNLQGLITRNEAEEVIRKLSFKSFEAEYKIMIVWLPEQMNDQAANTLLKILEEPWEKTLFIMVSAEPARLLPTIISRVQELGLGPVETEEVRRDLVERHGVDVQKAETIARLSRGDVIEARRMVGFGETGDTDAMFDMFVQLMRLSYNDRHMELLEWADTLATMGREEQKQFLVNALRLVRESYMLNAGMGRISYLWGHELDFCRKFSPFIDNGNIEALAAEIERTVAQVAQNGNPRIVFPHFALTVSKMIVRR
ncbi:MAG: DNA polymerase III subunit delta [Rikenellaceae bacterium]|jgi:DNA polymerase-3 subunit delta'|nr:DNA polymerase III subunit delta [Rikenellaceae bacterium]